MQNSKDPRSELGRRGEDLVARYLEERGYTLVVRNLRVGRLEIDLVARRGRVLVFCEVRARTSDAVMSPAQSIDHAKTRRIRDAARTWLRQQGSLREITDLRFDAASVTFDTPGGRLTYYEGAF